ncbi:FGGY-family carbohydrate kinase [Clostridia bacterium OttesenSCG-928-F22]|nr:FGGY-family carbohydrate kinase [Clostridia bacterium OttesenSCG-928-F22]
MAKYLIGSDVGTSGTKSVLIDEEGKQLASAYIEYPLTTPRPGWAEHDPEFYWNGVADTIHMCIQQSGVDNADIKGVSISALAPACILVDKDLNPLQNSHIWMDRRGTAQANWIKEKIGYEAFADKNPNPIDPYFATIKLMWERDNRPELYKKAYKVQTAADYPAMKLTGKPVTDYGNASLFGVGYDLIRRDWDTDYIERLGLDPEKFPKSYDSTDIIGEVTAEAAERTGLKKGTPVCAGTTDGGAAGMINGGPINGLLTITMGTAGVMRFAHEKPTFIRNLITTSYKDKYGTVAAISACGSLTRYFRDTFAQYEKSVAKTLDLDVFDIMTLEAQQAPLGSDGLMVLPYFMGERSPIWDPLARGVVFGMSIMHTKGHLLRAFMEGATYALYQNYRCMIDGGAELSTPIYLTEGGAKSALWRQIVCDVFNVPVAFKQGASGAPLGNALIAGVGTGVFKDFSVAKPWSTISHFHEPNAEAHEKYMEYYAIYQRLYMRLKDEYAELAKVTGYN